MDQLDEATAAQRAMWGAGDFSRLAAMIWPVGAHLVRAVGAGPGVELLDVGCGTGNVAIQAAEAGASVVGVDLAPEMLEKARAASAAAGLEITWIEGDAQALPVADASADAVVSSFGCMFAPRHEVAARELVRVLRPGGRMALATWSTDTSVAEFLRVSSAHLPPPPPAASPPLLWGDEDHVRTIFEGTGLELAFERATVAFPFASVEAAAEEYLTRFGPLVVARRALEPEGKWQALADDITAFFARLPRAADGGIVMEADYIVIRGTAPN